MGNSQKRAIKNYRSRLSKRGLARFEVLGLTADRGLIRSLARRLAEAFGRPYLDFGDLIDAEPKAREMAARCAPAVAVAILAGDFSKRTPRDI